MKPEASLPFPQEPTTCPYPEPDQSIRPHPILKIRFNIILQSTPTCSKRFQGL